VIEYLIKGSSGISGMTAGEWEILQGRWRGKSSVLPSPFPLPSLAGLMPLQGRPAGGCLGATHRHKPLSSKLLCADSSIPLFPEEPFISPAATGEGLRQHAASPIFNSSRLQFSYSQGLTFRDLSLGTTQPGILLRSHSLERITPPGGWSAPGPRPWPEGLCLRLRGFDCEPRNACRHWSG